MQQAPKDDPELQALAGALHQLYDPVLAEPVPERMRRGGARRRRAYAVAAAWLLLGIGVGMVAGWHLHASRTPAGTASDSPAFVRRAALAHATYTPEVRHAVEVGADQEAHLVAWLSKRLGAPLRAPKLEAAGFSLVGGRLLPSEASPKGGLVPTAQFMYQNAKGIRVTLYVRSEVAGNTETAFRYSAEGNVKVFYWIDRRFGYALSSSDIERDELLKLADAVYRQLNP